MVSISYEKKIYKPIITSLISILIIYLIPIFSHILPIPVSLFEPMRIVILVGYFYTRNRINAYALALSLPIFSLWITGHPAIMKSLIISAELFINIFILEFIIKNYKTPLFITISTSIVFSKIIYYGIKILFIYFNILNGPIISTSLLDQLYAAILITTCFTIVLSILNKRKDNNAR